MKKAPFLVNIMDTTLDLSKTEQLYVVFRYISIRENDNDVPIQLKICWYFLWFISVTNRFLDCSNTILTDVFTKAQFMKLECIVIAN